MPLTGLAVLVVAILGFAIGGSPPDVTKDSTATIPAFYADNNTQQAISAVMEAAAVSNADDLEPAGVQTLMSLYNNDFVPFAVGAEVFLLSIGLSVLTHRWLPRWLGVVLLLIAVLGVTPIGFVTFLASGLLIGGLGVLFALRERRTGEPTPANPPRRTHPGLSGRGPQRPARAEPHRRQQLTADAPR